MNSPKHFSFVVHNSNPPTAEHVFAHDGSGPEGIGRRIAPRDAEQVPEEVRQYFEMRAIGTNLDEGVFAFGTEGWDFDQFVAALEASLPGCAAAGITFRYLTGGGEVKSVVVHVEWTPPPPTPESCPKLPEWPKSCDHAHWGPGDWYEDAKAAILTGLQRQEPWTTGWYGVKKEIQSARISHLGGGEYLVEVSVSDDFDTEGLGDEKVSNPTLDDLRAALDVALAQADSNRRDNSTVAMYCVGHRAEDGTPRDWVETYLLDVSGWDLEAPPGDNYFEWGWQGDTDEIPAAVREEIERRIADGDGDPPFEVEGWVCSLVTD